MRFWSRILHKWTSDPRRLALPDSVASDPNAVELLAAWAAGGKVTVGSAVGTGLEKSPEVWGEILALLAGNIALAQSTTNADPHVLALIKEGMDREWGKSCLTRVKMHERLTDRARRVMQLADQEARRFNHEYLGAEHILLGLIKEGNGVAANVLKNLDVDPRKIRLEVEKLLCSGPLRVTHAVLPHTPHAKKVVDYSIEEALNLDHNYVGTEHFLLGLLRVQEGLPSYVLTNLGIEIGRVRKEVFQLLGRGLPPSRHRFGFG